VAEPGLFGTGRWGRRIIHGIIHDLAHAIEPESGATEAAVAPDHRRARALMLKNEF